MFYLHCRLLWLLSMVVLHDAATAATESRGSDGYSVDSERTVDSRPNRSLSTWGTTPRRSNEYGAAFLRVGFQRDERVPWADGVSSVPSRYRTRQLQDSVPPKQAMIARRKKRRRVKKAIAIGISLAALTCPLYFLARAIVRRNEDEFDDDHEVFYDEQELVSLRQENHEREVREARQHKQERGGERPFGGRRDGRGRGGRKAYRGRTAPARGGGRGRVDGRSNGRIDRRQVGIPRGPSGRPGTSRGRGSVGRARRGGPARSDRSWQTAKAEPDVPNTAFV